MSEPIKPFTDFNQQTLGYFSYLSTNSRAELEVPKRQKEPHKLSKSLNSFSLSSLEHSFISKDLQYKDPKYHLTRISQDFPLNKEQFKPPGPYSQSFNYPYMPSLYSKEPFKPEKKNFVLPASKQVFSQFEYISEPLTKAEKKGKSSKPAFVSRIHSESTFSEYPYGLEGEAPKPERFKKGDSRVFMAGGRSSSDLFGKISYNSEADFPEKKKGVILPDIHNKAFRRTKDKISVASPSILADAKVLKREFKIY